MALDRLAIEGIVPALTTPFERGEVNYDLLEHNINSYNAAPLAAYLVLGSTGEFPHLSRDERLDIVRVTKNVAGERPVIVGLGEHATRDAVWSAGELAGAGADYLLMVPPAYFGGDLTDSQLAAHHRAVADASPVPVLLYNIPTYAGVRLSPDLVEELADHPNIAGIKDSSGNLRLLAEYVARAPEGFTVLAGQAGHLLAALLAGARGGILGVASFAPFECCDLHARYQAGEFDRAARVQQSLARLEREVASSLGIPGVKWAMDLLGYFGLEPRAPFTALEDQQKFAVRQILMDTGLMSGV